MQRAVNGSGISCGPKRVPMDGVALAFGFTRAEMLRPSAQAKLCARAKVRANQKPGPAAGGAEKAAVAALC